MTIAQEQKQARDYFYSQLNVIFPQMVVYKNHCLIPLPNGTITCLEVASYPSKEEWEKRWVPTHDYLKGMMKGWNEE